MKINIYGIVVDEETRIMYKDYTGSDDLALSAINIKKTIDEHQNDDTIEMEVHCDGGIIPEGLMIYDVLRTSGKKVKSNIVGGCHSMAIIIHLAADAEFRTANPNCSALIHPVQTPVWDLYVGTDDLMEMTAQALEDEKRLLDIYAERTGKDREALRNLMYENKEHTANELLEWGFISRINSYNTNLRVKKMSKQTKGKGQNSKESILDRINKAVKGALNFDFTDENGTVLFSTDKETPDLAIGDKVVMPGEEKSGVFTVTIETDGMESEKTITIENEEVTAIADPDSSAAEVLALEEEVITLEEENKSLKKLLNEAATEITTLNGQVKSLTAKLNVKENEANATGTGYKVNNVIRVKANKEDGKTDVVSVDDLRKRRALMTNGKGKKGGEE